MVDHVCNVVIETGNMTEDDVLLRYRGSHV